MRPSPALWLLLLLPGVAAPLAAQDSSVRVYRCVGSNGAVSLQDAPCRDGRQEVREMQRPRDPAPRVVRSDSTPSTPPPAAPEREVRYVHVQPPQPMYECIRDDGSRYSSETSEGNPRWVPVWTSAWLPGRGPGGIRPGPGPRPGPDPRPDPRPLPLPPIAPMGSGSITSSGGSLTVQGGGSRGGGSFTVGSGSTQWHTEGSAYPGTYHDVVVPAGNVLVRDQCHPLPASEVCSILSDRRWELVRRYNSALQGERDAISREQRGVDARLDRDCR
ncbi:DUF4124 domain-containing protein [Stenotrophomonas aracearum]|jgi:hypothetical protein|uniref:DUF4124 domain-containing protein n=1 Tax=Stenotrophomonas aracearum TaxID=3003272 RepID=A0ABY9YBU9_9GAMM|nr:DUF4124 domain-containing protein [Stenotrophomonas sp. A5588]WNH48325.1 DUF4124 domain-containing protein [Stenotrophomonas sp. A5588]